jgi:hypothetical protein
LGGSFFAGAAVLAAGGSAVAAFLGRGPGTTAFPPVCGAAVAVVVALAAGAPGSTAVLVAEGVAVAVVVAVAVAVWADAVVPPPATAAGLSVGLVKMTAAAIAPQPMNSAPAIRMPVLLLFWGGGGAAVAEVPPGVSSTGAPSIGLIPIPMPMPMPMPLAAVAAAGCSAAAFAIALRSIRPESSLVFLPDEELPDGALAAAPASAFNEKRTDCSPREPVRPPPPLFPL